ncbi:MAG: hypothetical protein Q4C37_10890 [Bacteroidales bacterium]|nr:hypothetical protein [Bacteroidales bacterium]
MKKYLCFLFALMMCLTAAAQKHDRAKMMEEIQKFKIEFLAQEMNLSDKEKAEFTPVYKEFDDEMRKSGEEAFRLERQICKKKDATEEDYEKLAKLQKKSRENADAITKKYDKKFEKFLSAKQMYQMRKAEDKFLDKMKEMRKKHKEKNRNEKKNKNKKVVRKTNGAKKTNSD